MNEYEDIRELEKRVAELEQEFTEGRVTCNEEDIGVNRKWIKELEQKINSLEMWINNNWSNSHVHTIR